VVGGPRVITARVDAEVAHRAPLCRRRSRVARIPRTPDRPCILMIPTTCLGTTPLPAVSIASGPRRMGWGAQAEWEGRTVSDATAPPASSRPRGWGCRPDSRRR